MKIPDNKIKEWNSIMEPGDKKKIAELLKTAPSNVTTIFKEQEGTILQVSVISQFYKDRRRELKKIFK